MQIIIYGAKRNTYLPTRLLIVGHNNAPMTVIPRLLCSLPFMRASASLSRWSWAARSSRSSSSLRRLSFCCSSHNGSPRISALYLWSSCRKACRDVPFPSPAVMGSPLVAGLGSVVVCGCCCCCCCCCRELLRRWISLRERWCWASKYRLL